MTGVSSRRTPAKALVHAGLGVLLALLVAACEALFGNAPGFESLWLAGAGAFAAGIFFGWSGPIGFVLTSVAVSWLAPSTLDRSEVSVRTVLALLALGGCAHLALRRMFRAVALDGTPAYIALLAAAALGGGAAALLRASAGGSWETMTLWWAANLTSVVLLVPPAMIFLAGRRLPLLPRFAGGEDGAPSPTAAAPPSRERVPRWLDWVGPVLLVLLLNGLIYVAGANGDGLSSTGGVASWLVVLNIVPLIWVAHRRGLRGGALLGSLVGITYLVARGASAGALVDWQQQVMGQQAGALGLAVVGALLGASRDTERRLRRELEAANRRLRRELRSVVDALRSALGAKDAYTEGHVDRVASYAVATGRRLEMAEDDLDLLEVASLLHDVGKIGTPEGILHKPGPLDAGEKQVMQRHPEIGARILEDLEELRAAAPLVRHHQERFDGRQNGEFAGYPDGLAGEQIPLGARVIAVVDAFDAMTSDRSYRSALDVRKAKDILRCERGGQFDPRVVDAFLGVLDRRPWGE